MRIIKLGIISLIVFALLITGISLFFPSRVRISKAIDIESPRDSIWKQVAHMSNWPNWYPGADTMMSISDPREGDGLQANDGMIRLETVSDTAVTAVTTVPGVRDVKSGWNFYEGSRPNTVTVQWYMDFRLRWYPWEKFSSLLLEKRYGPVMERGLDSLKRMLEKQVER